MLHITAWLFLCLVPFAVSTRWQLSDPYFIYWVIIIGATAVTFALPIEEYYASLTRTKDRGYPIIMCLFIMIPSPYFIGGLLGRHPITKMIFKKLIYVLVFGLLIAQLIIER